MIIPTATPSDRFSSRKGGGQVKPVPWIEPKMTILGGKKRKAWGFGGKAP